MTPRRIPFSVVERWGDEQALVADAVRRGDVAAGGPDVAWCAAWLRERTGAATAVMTPSCTHALELAALVAGLGPGDEVVMPSWTFVSTANAVVLRGAVPVWADVLPETLCLDPEAVAAAVTPRTRAIVAVHYGGVAADLDALGAVARRHGLTLIEDAAHALLATWRSRPLGTFGDLGCLSFDRQKNVTCGEGGALLASDPALADAAALAAEKGTDRAAFEAGLVPDYAWQAPGSSWEMDGLAAAFLRAQLPHADAVTARRRANWHRYHDALEPVEDAGLARRPRLPAGACHNGHLYWLLLPDRGARDAFIAGMAARGIATPFHYSPLHRSPMGRRAGRAGGPLPVTERAGDALVRLPLRAGMTDDDVDAVVAAAGATLAAQNGSRSSELEIRSGSLGRAE